MPRKLSRIFSPLWTWVSFRRARWGILLQTAYVLAFTGIVHAQSALTFQSTQIKSDTGIRQVLTADFNNDGNPDLVFLQHFRITVVLGNGDGTFRPPLHAPVTATPDLTWMAVGDFNHDGKMDVVVFAPPSERSRSLMSKLISGKAMGRSPSRLARHRR